MHHRLLRSTGDGGASADLPVDCQAYEKDRAHVGKTLSYLPVCAYMNWSAPVRIEAWRLWKSSSSFWARRAGNIDNNLGTRQPTFGLTAPRQLFTEFQRHRKGSHLAEHDVIVGLPAFPIAFQSAFFDSTDKQTLATHHPPVWMGLVIVSCIVWLSYMRGSVSALCRKVNHYKLKAVVALMHIRSMWHDCSREQQKQPKSPLSQSALLKHKYQQT